MLTAEELLAAARQWFTAQTIVVGHANHPTVTTVYGDLLALIAERGAAHGDPRRRLGHPAQRLRGTVADGHGGRRLTPPTCARARSPTGWSSQPAADGGAMDATVEGWAVRRPASTARATSPTCGWRRTSLDDRPMRRSHEHGRPERHRPRERTP